MFDFDLIIPCYGDSKLIEKGIMSIAIQWESDSIHVTLVNDCSPNTDCNYQDLVDKYKEWIDIRCITTPENVGQGLARQYGVDHTTHDYFMFMDEDDQLGNGVSISEFVGAVEHAVLAKTPDGQVICDDEGNPVIDKNQKIAVAAGSLFAFDKNSYQTIENTNQVFINSKLYNRSFVEKHNIRFNEEQSRHAEDYFWSQCFYYCLDNDPEYTGILLDNSEKYYLWYPNPNSQSRVDPHYGYMLSGYTMNGSINILDFMKNEKLNGIEWNEDRQNQYKYRLINMMIYSYFTFFAFIRHVASTDYVPALELDWYLLRDSCNELRERVKDRFDDYSMTCKYDNCFLVKNQSDVLFTEPWIDLDDYILNGCKELTWDFDMLLKCKETMKFSEEGLMIWQD